MTWAIILALITYFLSPKDTAAERKQALLKATAVGGITYGVAEYTDWGKENLKPLDNTVSGFFTSDGKTGGDTGNSTTVKTGTGATSSGSKGLWDTVTSWGPTIAAAGAGAVVGSSMPSWLPLVLLGAGVYLVIK